MTFYSMRETGKYKNLWLKYLPVIKLFLKKSSGNPQSLNMQKHEFESVGDRDNSGYTFNLEMKSGRAINDISGSAVARDLRDILISDVETKMILANKKFKVNLDTNFVLHIRED